MNKKVFAALLSAAISISLISCGSKKEKETATTDVPGNTSNTADAPADKKGMSVAEAKDFLNADETNKGKEVTVSAYSWGSNGRMDDKIQLNLGDKKLEGAQSASFSCLFGKEQSAAIKAIAKDVMVTVTGKISKGSGGVELNDCKIVQ
jgi:hypothetical protein